MIYFDWKRIVYVSRGVSREIVLILHYITYQDNIPKSRKDPIYKYQGMHFDGVSFLKHPEILLANGPKYTDKEIAEYVGLASFRNLGEYFVSRKLTLDVTLSPMGLEHIHKNRLLRVEGEDIHFLYEDYNGDK